MQVLLRQDPVGRRRGRGDDVRVVWDGYDLCSVVQLQR